MQLDFSVLNTIAQTGYKPDPEATSKAVEKPVEESLEVTLGKLEELLGAVDNATEASPDPQRKVDGVALASLTRQQEDQKRYNEAYREYQNNIRRSGSLRSEILKGARAGESTQLLLLKAVECISCMTGDKLFYTQMEQVLKSVYGEVFLEEIPLQWEMEEVQDRLSKLKEYHSRTDIAEEDRRIISRSIREHEAKIAQLTELLGKSTNTDRSRAGH